ncbi:MAG: class C sortase [Clostridiales bacterium]|nr:class C sortase [Clostridiales bacterium]
MAKKKSKKHSWIGTVLLVLILLAGVGLLVYPTFSDWWNTMHQSRAIAGYVERISNADQEEIERLWEEAHAYNAELAKKGNRFKVSEEELERYKTVLDVTGTGIMGYIDIPKIDVSLPIYHSTSDEVLQIAVGHMEGTSLPVGGKGTHALLSGHTGLPSAKLFTNIDRLEEGDRFMINVLGRMLTYEVDQIQVVLPMEVEDLDIDPEQDYVTLITCTPYGVNTHRLLVRGRRVEEDTEEQMVVPAEAVFLDKIVLGVVVGVPVLLFILIMTLIFTRKKKKHARKGLTAEDEV